MNQETAMKSFFKPSLITSGELPTLRARSSLVQSSSFLKKRCIVISVATEGREKLYQIADLISAQTIPHGWHSRRRSEEHTSELQSRGHLVCRLLLEKK